MNRPTRPYPSPWTWALGLSFVAAGAAILGRVWWMSGRGLDLTDEGMYLNWMTTPWEWPWASTQFAFIYHPLWMLFEQDLAAMRRASVLILLLTAVGFFAAVFRRAFGWGRGPAIGAGALLAPTVLLAVGSQSVFFTPSYNLLGMMGLLISGAALVGILASRPGKARGAFAEHWPWLLLGVGGVVCFASRPTAGALLLLIVLAALPLAGAWSWRGLGTAAATAVVGVVAMALAIDGNPIRFIERVLEGLNLYAIQTQRSAADALVNTFTHAVYWQEPDLIAGGILGALVLVAMLVRNQTLTAVVSMVLALAGAWVAVSGDTVLSGNVHRSATVAAMLFLGAVLPSVWAREHQRRGVLVAAAALLLLPFAYAFGTHYSTVALAGSAAFCWLGSSLLVLGSNPFTRAHWPVVGGAWLLTTALCLNAAAGAAPRQEPLADQTETVAVAQHGEVGLSPDMARYLAAVNDGVTAAGFEPGTPVLDLTGESPGVIHHLRGRATADSWVIGLYPGSRDRLSRELTVHTECAMIAASWLLVTPDGIRRIDPEVLGDVGLEFPSDYERVMAEVAPERSRGYRLEVWRPEDVPELADRCAALR